MNLDSALSVLPRILLGVAACASLGAPILAEESAPALLRFLGRSHSLAVHFPIACLIGAALIELVRRKDGTRRCPDAVYACLVLGTIGALVAASFGWMNAEFEPHGKGVASTIERHRWVGVGVAALACVTLALAHASRRVVAAERGAWRLGLFASALLVGYGGHLGGTLVFGDGYLWEVFEEPQSIAPVDVPIARAPATPIEDSAGVAEDPGAQSSVPRPSADGVAEAVDLPAEIDFTRDVEPILAASCFTCHGPAKKKGGLRLDRKESLFKGDPEDWAVQPGNAAGSDLLRRVRLAPDHEDAMPQEGDPLGARAVAILERWIDQGARFPGDPPFDPATLSLAVTSATDAGTVIDGTVIDGVPAPPAEVLAALAARGALAMRIAEDSNLVEVSFGLLGSEVLDADLARLEGLEEQLVSLDLSRTTVGDAGLAALAKFGKLRRLRLDRSRVGDAGLVHVAELGDLESLNLYATSVSDAGLESLRGLAKLRKIYLWETGVSDAGVERLSAALPELEIVRSTLAAPAAPTPPDAASPSTCCTKAQEAGATCEHPCCVAAAEAGGRCLACNPHLALPTASPETCCEKARANDAACDHPCCVAAEAAGGLCTKCNPRAG